MLRELEKLACQASRCVKDVMYDVIQIDVFSSGINVVSSGLTTCDEVYATCSAFVLIKFTLCVCVCVCVCVCLCLCV